MGQRGQDQRELELLWGTGIACAFTVFEEFAQFFSKIIFFSSPTSYELGERGWHAHCTEKKAEAQETNHSVT